MWFEINVFWQEYVPVWKLSTVKLDQRLKNLWRNIAVRLANSVVMILPVSKVLEKAFKMIYAFTLYIHLFWQMYVPIWKLYTHVQLEHHMKNLWRITARRHAKSVVSKKCEKCPPLMWHLWNQNFQTFLMDSNNFILKFRFYI